MVGNCVAPSRFRRQCAGPCRAAAASGRVRTRGTWFRPAALSDLCFRSKAVWGYDPEFMALMLAALGVAGEHIAAGDVWVATGADRQTAGVVALAPGDAPGALDLNKLFIEPRHIRSGVGRALLAHAIAEARRRGTGRLTILADPNAAAFYERAGAVRIGEAPSDAVPGRLLPLYEVRLDSTGDRDLEPHLGGRSKR